MYALTATTPPSTPPDNSVVAGPLGFTVFILLIAATAFICWNFTKQLKKAQKAKDEGVFGDEPVERDADAEAPETHDAEA
ncbi:MAG TPA: hypothetical protein VJ872_05610 [Nocardioides sp.]|nr:hypothetical protein [Nocardioides sp.]